MKHKNNLTIEQYYNLQKSRLRKKGKLMPFSLIDVLGVMMFMNIEQIVVFDEENWEALEIVYDCIYYEGQTKPSIEPVGFRIIPKIIIKK